jgi:uncharacterized damage-inducible protein DinB
VTAALDHVLRHNAWATKTLLAHCSSLGAEVLELRAGGTYGTLYGALQHIVGAEQWYISLLTDEVLGSRIRRTERHSLDELMTVAVMTGRRAIEVAASDDAERLITPGGERTTVGVVLAQLVHHANEHRAHATTILGANGRATPKIGAWTYGLTNGLSDIDGD